MCEELKINPSGGAGEAKNQAENVQDDHLLAPPASHEQREETFSWKDEIAGNFRLWIENLEKMPSVSVRSEEPDLYSFYEQLCILRSEFRKNSRRSHETFNQFAEHLEEFQVVIDSLAKRLERIGTEQDSTEFLARQGLFVQMVELFERLWWLGEKLKENGATSQRDRTVFGLNFLERIKGLFAGRQKPPGGIPDSIREGYFLILSHFEEFLTSEGVTRIKATGMAFDPTVMIALGTVETDACPPNTIFEEISGGYRYGEHILKLAKVTVTKRKEP
jgi:molecular chaperone GrpE